MRRGDANQLDERPERGVTRGDSAMRGGGVGRWEVAAREARRRDNQPDGQKARKEMPQ